MSTTNSFQKSPNYKNITLKGEPMVHLSSKVWDKIRFLCNKISQVEWSGCIFYKFLSEDATLSDTSSLTIKIMDLIPLDKGTTGFTEYNFDERVLKYMTEMDYFDLKIGHIHSHHNMKTFFSGTDMSELNDNSEFIKPYLSLIVNNHQEFSCKLGFRVQSQPAVYQYQDVNGEWTKMTSKEDADTITVAAYDCKIYPPIVKYDVDDRFMIQFEEIMKPKPMPKQISKSQQLELFDDTFHWHNSLNNPIVTTDKEQGEGPTLRELELMSCCILRLGQKFNYDTLELVLEDIENSINQRQMNPEKYCKQLSTNIRLYIEQYWGAEITDDELEMFTGDFLDELVFLQDEFPLVTDIILEFDKSIL